MLVVNLLGLVLSINTYGGCEGIRIAGGFELWSVEAMAPSDPLHALKLRWPFHPWGKWAESWSAVWHTKQCDTQSSVAHKEWCAFTCTPTSRWAPTIPRVGTLPWTFSFWWIQLAFSGQHSQHLGEIRTLVLKEMSKWHTTVLRIIYM